MTDAPVNNKNLKTAYALMKEKKFAAAKKIILAELQVAQNKADVDLQGICHAAMGMLHKLQLEFAKSYKSYQQAEHLLKDDLSVKLITAALLIEQFKQYETAIHKLETVLGGSPLGGSPLGEQTSDPAIIHRALVLQGLAYFRLSRRDQALQNFDKVLAMDFKSLRSSVNVDFRLVAAFVDKGFAVERCTLFLNKAMKLALAKNEKVYVKIIDTLLRGIRKNDSEAVIPRPKGPRDL